MPNDKKKPEKTQDRQSLNKRARYNALMVEKLE
jgi:hypothetical protein